MVELEATALANEVDRELNRRTLQLNADVTHIRTQVDETAASVTRLETWSKKTDKRLDGLSDGIRNVHKRFGRFESKIDKLDFGQWNMTNRLQTVDDEVKAVSAVQACHGTILEEHSERLDKIDGRLETIDGQLGTVRGQLDRLIDAVIGGDSAN